MSKNPLAQIPEYGQSIWLDFIQRSLFGGNLQRLIDEDKIRGMTSNPSIFEEAIANSDDYNDTLRQLTKAGKETKETYWEIAIEDVQRAADIFRPVYDDTDGRDGFVSLEVSPHLARDTQNTIQQVHQLWEAVDRPNIFIKIPGTREGLPAIQQCLSDGINVNITLLFSLPRYRMVTEAFMAGLEERMAQGKPIDNLASVASFFLSRIDVLVDGKLEEKMEAGGREAEIAQQLHGNVAVASARVAYQMYKEIFSTQRWQKLAKNGARTQRLLWASTSTKNPDYSDVKYVEALIGPETVNTLPMRTIDAFRDHGKPAMRLENDIEAAQKTLAQLAKVGIDLDAVTDQLEEEGIEKFVKPFDRLLKTLQEEQSKLVAAS